MTGQSASHEQEFTDLLHNLYRQLVGLERTIATLAEATTDGFILWGFPQSDAASARDALRVAPSLTYNTMPPSDPPPASVETIDSLADLAEQTRRTLIAAGAQAADPGDKAACLNAAMFLGRLHQALR